jgi:hypothetical protein
LEALLNSIGGKLGYRFGNRPIEKIIAFGVTGTAIVWFEWKNHSISLAAGTGLLLGVLAAFFINMLGVSAMFEGWLLMAAVIFIGLKFGAAALGMSLLGWLFFTAIYLGVVSLSNRLLDGHW